MARPTDEPGPAPMAHARAGRGLSVLLLRHAWALERAQWEGADRRRPLSGRGRAQAQALPGHLAALGVMPVMLVATPTERSAATLGPLARSRGLPIHEDERFTDVPAPLRCDDGWGSAAWLAVRAMAGLDQVMQRAVGIVVDPEGRGRDGRTDETVGRDTGSSAREEQAVVVCAHGETLPALLAGLGARDGWRLERGPDVSRKAMPKGGGWLLSPASRRVVVIEPPVIPETTDPGGV